MTVLWLRNHPPPRRFWLDFLETSWKTSELVWEFHIVYINIFLNQCTLDNILISKKINRFRNIKFSKIYSIYIYSDNSSQYAESIEPKTFRPFLNLLKFGKILEGIFLRLRFQLMHYSKQKAIANKQFQLVDNDAQHIGGDFFITVPYFCGFLHQTFPKPNTVNSG